MFDPKNVIFGPRRRDWLIIALGAICLVLSMCALWGTGCQAKHLLRNDYIHLRPTTWLIDEIGSRDRRLRHHAVDELLRRYQAHDLSASQVASMKGPLLNVHVMFHARLVQWHELISLLGEMHASGDLTDVEKDRFFRHLQTVQCRYLPERGVIDVQGYTFGEGTGAMHGLVSRHRIDLLSIDDNPVHGEVMTFYSHQNLSYGWDSEALPEWGDDRLATVDSSFTIRMTTTWLDFGPNPPWDTYPDVMELDVSAVQSQPSIAHVWLEDWRFTRENEWTPTRIATGTNPTTMPSGRVRMMQQ